ncbi:4042_t:CDS:10 [Entrophospora sp. SA101]|nr:4042_t:CDS:10 [Entrophospora sp. SA101]
MFKSIETKIIARWAFNTKNWIPTTKEYDQLLSLIQTNEREKIKKIKVLENSKSSLIGRLLMILLFNRIYGIDYREVEFDRTEYNKPILINPKLNILCDFNISHHGDWVVLVAGENCRIGIDLMKIEQPNAGYNVKEFITTFKDQFTENEFNLLVNNQQRQYNKEEVEIHQLQRFYRFWCLKESYVKANTKIYVNNELKVEWGFEEHCLDEEHCVCIAYDTNRNSNNGDDRKETINEGFEIIEIQDIFNLTVEAAYACDASLCKAPDCFCATQTPPGGLTLDKTPQFVLLTFDDSIQDRSVKVAYDLIGERKNPNGCPIKTTFYVSINYTDFSLVSEWYAKGHEVADHTMTHNEKPPDPSKEIIGCKKALNAFAGIPNGKISGFRNPFLDWTPKVFDVLATNGFAYDTSTTSLAADDTWPYTLDYGLYNDCDKGFCDTVKHPGLFEIPMSSLIDEKSLPHLMDPTLDGTPDQVMTWLKDNFNRHAKQGKTPFGVYLHPVQLSEIPGRPSPEPSIKMLKEFFDWALTQPNVWFVTNQQLLQWMKNPVPADQLKDYAPFKCQTPNVGKEICNGLDDDKNGQADDGLKESCNFDIAVWSTCYGCPKVQPTVDNPVPDSTNPKRYRVPTTCDTLWWDPIENKCLCSTPECSYTDQSKIPNDVNSNASSSNNITTTPSATPSNNSNNPQNTTSDSTIIFANTKLI